MSRANTLSQPPREAVSLRTADVFEVMRDLGHGRVENLLVAGGVPRITDKTKFFHRYLPGKADPPPDHRQTYANCRPHAQHEKLLAHCRELGDGVVGRVEVADGLPVFWGPA